MDFETLKLIHILSATLLFGTGIGSAFYMLMAVRGGEPKVIHATARHVVLADWLFTTPAIIVQPTTGIMLLPLAGYEFGTGWIGAAIALYVFAGACWVPVVIIQMRLRDLANSASANDTELLPDFWRLFRWWVVLGSLAFPALVAVFYLMVAKPF